MSYKTDQEEFWAGAFGDEYSDRNVGRGWIAANAALFSKVLARTNGVSSVIELGANIGLNLRPIELLLPEAKLAGVEINNVAAETLRGWARAEAFEQSILDFVWPRATISPSSRACSSISIRTPCPPSTTSSTPARRATSAWLNITIQRRSRSPIAAMTTGCSSAISRGRCSIASPTSGWWITASAGTATRISRRTT